RHGSWGRRASYLTRSLPEVDQRTRSRSGTKSRETSRACCHAGGKHAALPLHGRSEQVENKFRIALTVSSYLFLAYTSSWWHFKERLSVAGSLQLKESPTVKNHIDRCDCKWQALTWSELNLQNGTDLLEKFPAMSPSPLSFPQEVIDKIVDDLEPDEDLPSLLNCSLTSRSFLAASRRVLFNQMTLGTDGDAERGSKDCRDSKKGTRVGWVSREETLPLLLPLLVSLKFLAIRAWLADEHRHKLDWSILPPRLAAALSQTFMLPSLVKIEFVELENIPYEVVTSRYLKGLSFWGIPHELLDFRPFPNLRVFSLDIAFYACETFPNLNVLPILITQLRKITSDSNLEEFRLLADYSPPPNDIHVVDDGWLTRFCRLPFWQELDLILTHPRFSKLRRVDVSFKRTDEMESTSSEFELQMSDEPDPQVDGDSDLQADAEPECDLEPGLHDLRMQIPGLVNKKIVFFEFMEYVA
ncbi:uncharacterized protein LACBIDRAFT_332952, partial [Laccaria bicolor S238N-H82]